MNELPPWYVLAQAEIGVKEAPGFANNPIVKQYYIDAGGGKQPDSVPWCAAFVGAMLRRSGHSGSGFLAARSYLTWGVELKEPRIGCVVVFARGRSWQGHVAFFNRRNENGTIRVLGGNQDDMVKYASYNTSKVLGYRWPHGVTLDNVA
jgi:uncharacterized protein (TIGR02594 family)